MNPNLAEENLQTIRTLMERSALYRRALAPIMLMAGGIGLAAAAAGLYFHIETSCSFAELWLGTACLVVTSAFLLARRQAIKDSEPFWSPPTYRVGQALLPPLFSGMFIGVLMPIAIKDGTADFPVTLAWLLFYGCALHSAGFFMVRGIKWFGWIFIAGAIVLTFLVYIATPYQGPTTANWVKSFFIGGLDLLYACGIRGVGLNNLIMGIFFGGLHVAYGVYLYFTEKKNPAA